MEIFQPLLSQVWRGQTALGAGSAGIECGPPALSMTDAGQPGHA